ncbi:sialic acid TRAP transporter substrate-binding protein SiaP [Petroclostridium sp. X23]|uniref:sialic acid TRAP transporter substrate-binding protein SiaP n=1 Tax=Petroclostridium sp. X23 TaxID=3045146 RepID=UPI0024AD7D89|nr:sialic acid TRAP transporter substrate-binding protein SiaP [Petroclostridium sp. X23]WHH59072.1 sialic acid TRAP transporter substrate-binding protein SiaP [Petroclostridium sp. X23]
MSRKTRKTLALVLAAVFVLTLAFTGCAPKQEEAKDTPGQEAPKQEAPKQDEKKAADKVVTYKLAHVYAPDHPFSKGMDKLAETVKTKSNGKLVINHYPAAQLGSEKDIADGIVNGIVDMAIIGPGELGKRFKPILVFDAPYVFRDVDHMQKVTTGDVGNELWEKMASETGIRELAALYYGTRYVTTSKVPIKTPADLKGLKLRAPDQPLSVANAKAMGANPTPMALSEVYLALQQGVVDGQENPIPTIASQKFNEVQKYINLTGHVVQVTPIVMSEKKLKELPDDLKQILMDAVKEIAPTINQEIADNEKATLEEFKKGGMEVIESDVEAFRTATASVIKEFESTWGQGLFEKIQAVK